MELAGKTCEDSVAYFRVMQRTRAVAKTGRGRVCVGMHASPLSQPGPTLAPFPVSTSTNCRVCMEIEAGLHLNLGYYQA